MTNEKWSLHKLIRRDANGKITNYINIPHINLLNTKSGEKTVPFVIHLN
jgi:hypothetical protein